MERSTIILICLAFIVVWMLGKRFLANRQQTGTVGSEPDLMKQVDAWFSVAQEQIGLLEETARADREATWDAMDRVRQLEITDEFLSHHFGEAACKLYRDEEKLRIGSVYFIGTPQEDT